MAEKYVILPCNGLDKCAGLVTRELALKLHERWDSEIICPVFYRVSEAKYNKLAAERPLLVIDGCPTRCASKLAVEKNLKVARRIIVADEAKKHRIGLNDGLRITDLERRFIDDLFEELNKIEETVRPASENEAVSYNFDYETIQNRKFIFRIPKNGEVFFNENDCWAWVNGNRARIGVTDYVQQNLSDILYFYPPEVGDEIDQFGESGSIESSKAVFELVSPFSGKVVAINDKLATNPELINENPYELGWIAELELTDPEGDKELLIGFERYIEITQKKVEDADVK
ncbi:MAG TPA: putative zinc-binding protein [Bacteroidales bacterium]|nr:putative zinc-binding protein [Bacteroidales bacterium]HPT10031.1 putative zinc-binding protein [Bacteroidales bacterium]